MAEIRYVIIHYHIFKNAGATIDAVLKKNFADNWAEVEGRPQTYRLSSADLLGHIVENPHLVAVSSHEARPPVPISGNPNLKFLPILFIRHPIDRIGSIYSYRRSQPDAPTRSAKIAREKDLAGYIRWCLDNPGSETISNFQTTFLSGSDTDPWNAPDLDLALSRLQEMPFWGVVEHFDKSLFRLQDYISRSIGRIDLSYTIVNKSTGRKDTFQERIQEIKSALGSVLYQELIEKNSLDLQLYDKAIRVYEKRTIAEGES